MTRTLPQSAAGGKSPPDSKRRGTIDARTFEQFRAIVGKEGLISKPEQLRIYECDGLTNFRVVPAAVLVPISREQVQEVLRICHKERIPFVAHGSGTGLSGGALPVAGGIVISLARNRIPEIDIPNARVGVEPGVINLTVTQAVRSQGYFYAPDPSSQQVCSIGGNVAENSGGAHCLKYGFTTTQVLGLEVMLPDGSIAHLGGRRRYASVHAAEYCPPLEDPFREHAAVSA